ncbi:hypothetical protein [Embleya sp. NBC_00896]|uniref:hypothetical protein n=1 Tax=Embleya sp. NBC_00896 TaxID=2975961 RepID=UPI002F91BECE|nr:hypothetical protein OG928_38465 [Embleya sp. NBC_00896]
MTAPNAQHRMRLFDHRIPSLYAGKYDLTIDQTITGINTADRLPKRQQPFDVRELRFSIAPTDVLACYPAPGSIGLYSQILPHITMDTPAVPWFRPLHGHDKSVPWMAVMVFRENELPEDPQALGKVKVATVRDLLDDKLGGRAPEIPAGAIFDDEWDLSCNTILVPGALFTALVPRPDELGLLAHVREGGPPDATRAAGSDPEPVEGELNAVVVGNRFPDVDGGLHVAHVVSLDGFEAYLGGNRSFPGDARMVSLWSWTFETEPDSGVGFGDLVQHLATEGRTPAQGPPDLLLRLPTGTPPGSPTPAQREVIDRFATGSTALPQRLETGERTVAFHRGPFIAAPAQRLPAVPAPRTRLESAGEALIYLERHGVFDAGYAAAFTLGRSLALADADFRTSLLAFRKAARSAARRMLSHPRLVGRAVTAAELTGNPTRDAFDRLLLDEGGARFARALGRAGGEVAAGRRRAAPRTARQPAPRAADIRATLASESVRGLLRTATATELQPVAAWLERLRVLDMIPMEHLVPHAGMLPVESIRFFHIDAGWVRAAVDGALSVGVGHTLDADLNALAAEVAAPPTAGVLIHSALIPNWPKTIITAYNAAGAVLTPVREAVYGTEVKLFLYPSLVAAFTLAEPPQGLHFGFGDNGTIERRKISGTQIGYPDGEFPSNPGDDRFGRFLRPGGHDVINLTGPGDPLLPALSATFGGATLSSAQFALQMIKAPQLQTFDRS